MSYAIGRAKSDFCNHYRSNDPRICPVWIKSEADIRELFEPGGRDHKLVAPGGAWRRHVQMYIAERDKDCSDAAREMWIENNRLKAALGMKPSPLPEWFFQQEAKAS